MSCLAKFLFLVLIFSEKASLACAVCGFGQDGSQAAYILTTAILTASPLVAIGSVVLFVYVKTRRG